jgi:methyl acetate hydrolase
MDELLQQASGSGAVPGIAAIVTTPDGPTYEGYAGRLSIEGDEPVTAETVFRLASMTKALASVAAMQLVEQGRLELDQPVASVLPEFRDLWVLEGFDGDQPKLRPPAHPATIRHLLTHTSGAGYAFNNKDLTRHAELTGHPHLLTGRREAIATPLLADPGTAWHYGVSTDWLGLVVEKVTGQTLGEYLREHVFTPLGMTDATFRPDEQLLKRTMTVHERQADGSLAVSDIDLPLDPDIDSGGSGLYATARDYERFLRAMLRGGELDGTRILESETVDLMLSDHLRGIELPELIETADPRMTNDVPALPFKQGWGLGFHLTLEDVPGMRHSGTGDWAGLFNCYYWLDRDSGVAGMLLTQVLPFFDMGVLGTLVQFEQAAYAQAQAGAATPA